MTRTQATCLALLLMASTTLAQDLDPEISVQAGQLRLRDPGGLHSEFFVDETPIEEGRALRRGAYAVVRVDVVNRGNAIANAPWSVRLRPPAGWKADALVAGCRDFTGGADEPLTYTSQTPLNAAETRRLCVALVPANDASPVIVSAETFLTGDANPGNNQAVSGSIAIEPPRDSASLAIESMNLSNGRRAPHAARGLSINVPLVGRVVGGGETLYRTSVDVSNNTSAQTNVDFYFDGRDNTGLPVTATGSISNIGLVPTGQAALRGMTNAHFDDFIQALVDAGFMTAQTRDRGVIGSLFLVFDSFTRRGEGSATARFYSELAGGTVGVAISGREITTDEPRALSGFVQDTRGSVGQQQYANIFLNHTGLTRSGTPAGPVIVEVRAVSANTGTNIGRAVAIDIAPGHTVTISDVTAFLQIAREPAIVFARVTAGDGAIHGVVSTLDAVTRDGSVVYMNRAD